MNKLAWMATAATVLAGCGTDDPAPRGDPPDRATTSTPSRHPDASQRFAADLAARVDHAFGPGEMRRTSSGADPFPAELAGDGVRCRIERTRAGTRAGDLIAHERGWVVTCRSDGRGDYREAMVDARALLAG